VTGNLEKYEVNVLIIFLGRQFDFQRPKAQCGTGNSKTGCYSIVVVSLYIFCLNCGRCYFNISGIC